MSRKTLALVACLAAACSSQVGGPPADSGARPENDGGSGGPDGGGGLDGGSGGPDGGGGLDGGSGGADGGSALDGGSSGADGGAETDGGSSCVLDRQCGAGRICWLGVCISDVPCADGGPCQDDRYCQQGRCVPYGQPPREDRDTSCSRIVPAGLLSPLVACEWLRPEDGDPFPDHRQVLATPLVVDFNFDGRRGTDDPTTRPSIVFPTYDGLDGRCGLGDNHLGDRYGVLRVIDGRTCQLQFNVPSDPSGPHVNGATTPAVGDLDGDGRADIVTYSATGGLVAFRFDPQAVPPGFVPLWTSHDATGAPHNPFAGICNWTGPTLADLDDDGLPEVLAEGYVYDSTGRLVDATAGDLAAAGSHGTGQFAVAADMDGDGAPELVSARRLFRWDRAASRWQLVRNLLSISRGYVAVADFGVTTGATLDRTRLDGIAEIAVVSGGRAWILALDGTVVFGPKTLPASTGGGPPTIGDFDNDGRPELAAAGSDSYTVFDPDCVSGASREYCPTGRADGILWSSPSQDHSSNITGSSLFDFEGNGTAEAVYADECYARIYDGRTGVVLFSQPHSSCTWNEYPVVADVAGNFRSRLIVPSNENCDVACPPVDPNFDGLRCLQAGDCPNGVACIDGFCRCQADADCNTAALGGGFVCRAPRSGGGGNTCQAAHTSKRSGVRVFGDVLDRWASSRPIWNQHAYSVTNVERDGTIPRTSRTARNWTVPGLNNFRMNVQGTVSPTAAPDVTARAPAAIVAPCGEAGAELAATVCNRGTAPVGDSLLVAFYEGAELLCVARTEMALAPGTCADVSCRWIGGRAGTHEVVVVADDDGTGTGAASECAEDNNRAALSVECRPL